MGRPRIELGFLPCKGNVLADRLSALQKIMDVITLKI